MCMYTHMSIYIYRHVCIHIYIYLYIYIHIHVRVFPPGDCMVQIDCWGDMPPWWSKLWNRSSVKTWDGCEDWARNGKGTPISTGWSSFSQAEWGRVKALVFHHIYICVWGWTSIYQWFTTDFGVNNGAPGFWPLAKLRGCRTHVYTKCLRQTHSTPGCWSLPLRTLLQMFVRR